MSAERMTVSDTGRRAIAAGRFVIAGFLLLTVLTPAALADTIYVNGATGDDTWDGLCEMWDGGTCGPKATIQAGIDATSDSDEVVVADGTYTGEGNKNLDFCGKAITVRSASGDPATCIIDCEEDGRGFYFHSGETADSVISALTMVNGESYGEGCVQCENSSPTLTHCTIAYHVVYGDIGSGGGLYCNNSSPTLSHCTLYGNISRSENGGAVYCRSGSSPTFTKCAIYDNAAQGDGGGISCSSGSTVTMTNCTIMGNDARHGGGINCTGGSSLTLTNCTIRGNTSRELGGGIRLRGGCSAGLTNCTILDNTAHDYGGGICYSGSSGTATNCVFWNNSAPQGPVIALLNDYEGTPATLSVSYSDVQGGFDAAYVEDGSTLEWGPGIIDADPLWAFPDDQRLLAGSPCIDAGTNDPPGGLPAEDSDGNPRPLDGDGDAVSLADIGVYEFNLDAPSIAVSPPRLTFIAYEDGPAPSSETLLIRNCGGGTLQWEISTSSECLTVDPESGTSDGEVNEVEVALDPTLWTTTQRTAWLTISDPSAANDPRAVRVDLPAMLRVPDEYATIQAAIDAAINGDEVVIADGVYAGEGNKHLDFAGKTITVRSAGGDPASCVIDCEYDGLGFWFHNSETAAAVVDGLTIRHGDYDNGAGVTCHFGSSPTLRNCAIRDCVGVGVGCLSYAHPTLQNCTIAFNYGSGVFCNHSSPTLLNCTVRGNHTESGGAAIRCRYASSPTLTNCTVYDNASGVYCDESDPSITNCILWNNSASGGHELTLIRGSTLSVRYSDVQGGFDAAYIQEGCTLEWGPENIDVDPSFAFADDLHLLASSPCIDAGTDEPPGELPPDDPDGNPRSLDGDGDGVPVADMGVYEFNLDAPSVALSPTRLAFFVLQGGPAPPSQTFSIRNCGGGTLEWQIHVVHTLAVRCKSRLTGMVGCGRRT